MADFVIRVGSTSAQGRRANNEDRFALFDTIAARMYLVAYPHAEAKWKAIAAAKFP